MTFRDAVALFDSNNEAAAMSGIYEAAKNDHLDGNHHWREITLDQYMESLEVMPPMEFDGRTFLWPEAQSHDSRGVAIRYAFAERKGRWFIRLIPEDQFAAAKSALAVDVDTGAVLGMPR